MSGLRKLAGQTAIYGLSSIVGRLVNFWLFPIYTYVFLPEEYGVVTELYAYVAFLIVMLTYGMETAFFRFSSQEKDLAHRQKIFSTSLISVFVTAALFLILSQFWMAAISSWMGYESHPEYIRYFIWIIALDAVVTIPFARLRLLNKPIPFALINVGTILVNIGLNLFLILYCPAAYNNPDAFGHSFIQGWYDPSIGIGYIFIANLISSALKFLLLSPWMKDVFTGWHRIIFKKLFPYALPLLILGLAGIINETFDRAFYTRLSGLSEPLAKAQLGIYGACYKIAMLLSIGIQAYRFAAEPFVFSLKSGTESNKTQADIMKYYIIVASFLTLIILCFLDLIILMIGKEFREGRDVIPILLVSYIFFGALFNLSFWFKLNDKTKFGALIAITGAVVTIILNVILVPKIGYYGSAWATFAAYAAMLSLSLYLGQRLHPIPYNYRELLGYLVVAAGLYGAHRILNLPGNYTYFTASLASLMFLGYLFYREKNLILKILNFGTRNHK